LQKEADYSFKIESYAIFFGGTMDPLAGIVGQRRNEDIALDMMKFIASTTNYGKTAAVTGFHAATENKSEDYAKHLLELYTRCLDTVNGKK
jgi:hypothetical protein